MKKPEETVVILIYSRNKYIKFIKKETKKVFVKNDIEEEIIKNEIRLVVLFMLQQLKIEDKKSIKEYIKNINVKAFNNISYKEKEIDYDELKDANGNFSMSFMNSEEIKTLLKNYLNLYKVGIIYWHKDENEDERKPVDEKVVQKYHKYSRVFQLFLAEKLKWDYDLILDFVSETLGEEMD